MPVFADDRDMAAFLNITSNVSNMSKPLIADAILLPVGLVLVMENIIRSRYLC